MSQMGLQGFHVIAVVENVAAWESRYENFLIFEEDIVRKGANLWVLELQTGARLHRITNKENPQHIQLWSSALPGELWHKEQMINTVIQHIIRQEPSCRYVAWIDADCKFEAGALEKTVQALQIWDVVQMWSHLVDLGPNGGCLGSVKHSFMYCYWHNISVKNNSAYLMGGAPGLAWAARRDALNKLGCAISGPVLDFAILGSGDRNFACALLGEVDGSLDPRFNANYLKWMHIYQDNALRTIKKNVGYVENTVRHLDHGDKLDRGYVSRWEVLVKWDFNPETDLARDVSGMYRLVSETPRQWGFRDDVRRYNRARNEDRKQAKNCGEWRIKPTLEE